MSERNWRIFALNGGFADGRKWSFRELADKEGISHVRVWQIVGKTRKHLREYLEARGRSSLLLRFGMTTGGGSMPPPVIYVGKY